MEEATKDIIDYLKPFAPFYVQNLKIDWFDQLHCECCFEDNIVSGFLFVSYKKLDTSIVICQGECGRSFFKSNSEYLKQLEQPMLSITRATLGSSPRAVNYFLQLGISREELAIGDGTYTWETIGDEHARTIRDAYKDLHETIKKSGEIARKGFEGVPSHLTKYDYKEVEEKIKDEMYNTTLGESYKSPTDPVDSNSINNLVRELNHFSEQLTMEEKAEIAAIATNPLPTEFDENRLRSILDTYDIPF